MPSLAGSFLVARRSLRDSSFRQTVVLLLQHGEEGAFGLVINRPARVKKFPFPIFAGGPCESEGLLMLHGHAEWLDDSDSQPVGLPPGVYMGNATCLQYVEEPQAGIDLRFRLFKGYSGWAPGQLESELAVGAWSVVPANAQLVFDTPPDELWERLAPSRIPEPSLN